VPCIGSSQKPALARWWAELSVGCAAVRSSSLQVTKLVRHSSSQCSTSSARGTRPSDFQSPSSSVSIEHIQSFTEFTGWHVCDEPGIFSALVTQK
jgi:hypothetical protein